MREIATSDPAAPACAPARGARPRAAPARAAAASVEVQIPEPLATVTRILGDTADGAWVSDERGTIRHWNAAAAAILGHPADEVVGRACCDVFGGRDGRGNPICLRPCPVKTLLAEGHLVEHFEMATRKRIGVPVWLDVSCIVVRTAAAEPPAILHLFRDVTVAHQIEALVREQLARAELRAPATDEAVRCAELTPRELQVLSLLRLGATTRAIAEALYVSRATVRNHVQRILGKLGVHTRLEAVAYANRVAS